MPSLKIALVVAPNQPNGPTDAVLDAMAFAVNNQIKHHVAPAWHRAPMSVTAVHKGEDVPDGAMVLLGAANSDVQGALGYHTEDSGGTVYGRWFWADVLGRGGDWLSPGSLGISVASIVSHEAIELFLDPAVNLWADDANKYAYAVELCDPVESDTYTVKGPDGSPVSVSNFVYPSFFDEQSPRGKKHDHMGRLKAPFTMTRGGYLIYRFTGPGQQVRADSDIQQWTNKHGQTVAVEWGPDVPDWRRKSKTAEIARTYQRAHGKVHK